MKRHETHEHWRLFDAEAEREHGPDGSLVEYERDGGDTESLCITLAESEDFERETGGDLDSDVLSSETFDELLEWTRDNGLLREGEG